MSNQGPTRRQIVTGAAGLVAAGAVPAGAAPARAKPKGFLWGTAISGHQSEGGNTNSDGWFIENQKPTSFRDPSGDGCDSYHRYEEDLDIAKSLGLNCYRFGIEWSRIEPVEGQFSEAALAHYERVLKACHARKLMPMVTFNHFTVPLWFAMRGGFEVADGADIFARFCGHVSARLGHVMGMATTFNEANIVLLRKVLPRFATQEAADNARAMIAEAARRTNSPRFSSMLFADPEKITPILIDAHAKAYAAMKAAAPNVPVGITLTMQDMQGIGPHNKALEAEATMYGGWLNAARAHSDFVGVQTYSRLRFDAKGLMKSELPLTDAGYENYPAAVGATLRYAAKHIDKPIYLTETGIAAEDDAIRVKFIEDTIAEVRKCMAEGIAVKGYLYWSLLDNFEWVAGYSKKFGLVGVDLKTFKRTIKPSAWTLAKHAKANLL